MTTPELTRSSRYESAVCVSTAMQSPSFFRSSALLIILLLRRAVVHLDLRLRLQRAQRLVAADDDLIAGLQTLGNFDVGDARNSGVHGAEQGLLAIHDENALNL